MGGEVHHPPPQQNTTPGIHTPSALPTTATVSGMFVLLDGVKPAFVARTLQTLKQVLCISLFASSPAYQPPAASNYHFEPEPVRQAVAAPPPSSGVMYYTYAQTQKSFFFLLTKGLLESCESDHKAV